MCLVQVNKHISTLQEYPNQPNGGSKPPPYRVLTDMLVGRGLAPAALLYFNKSALFPDQQFQLVSEGTQLYLNIFQPVLLFEF